MRQEQAAALFLDFVTGMHLGCDIFSYWNMVLDEMGESRCEWRQNSLATIDRRRHISIEDPDYGFLSLLSRHIRAGFITPQTIASRHLPGTGSRP